MTTGAFKFSVGAEEKLLVFETDFSAYHLDSIRDGIECYFLESERSLRFTGLGIAGLREFLGPSVEERICVIGAIRSTRGARFFRERRGPWINLVELPDASSAEVPLRTEGEGTLAGRYFLDDVGCESLAFIGNSHAFAHQRRLKEFSAQTLRQGLAVEELYLDSSVEQRRVWEIPEGEWVKTDGKITAFLNGLVKPAGCFVEMTASR